MPTSRDWVVIVGVMVLLFFCLAWALPDHRKGIGAAGNKARAEDAYLAYLFGVLDVLAIATWVSFRRGLASIGLPEVWSWVVAPVSLMVVITASIIAAVDDSPGGGWLLTTAIFLALFFAYLAVAVGPEVLWNRLTTPAN